ncbi:DUF881 domain-containing protein [Clostridium sp. Sa3CUN1]|uniref:DUF881 domain-containing protein n=1 Tax=Clostridium gallinarum TaxID=2762246 RepID=A0ABR8PZP9_9CLOT|nr:DUF881 domain-containing protein [Clostridium gallinarum]MBD7913640.1 DUF881 domain-containing protein [Clostridium gallinarum]
MKKLTSQIFVAIVCAFLGFLLAHQFKLLNEKDKINVNSQNGDIIAEIEALKKEKEELSKTNSDLSEQLKELEEKASNNGALEAEIKKQLDNARMNLGLLDVKGPGIIITITPKTNIFGSNTDNRTISEDEIVHVVNSLRYIKAEAISVNDYRLTPQTGIKSSGNWIWIGTSKIDPTGKIVIKAIGDKQALKVAANFIGVLDYGALRNYQSEVSESDEIIITKTTQSLKNEYIKPVN